MNINLNATAMTIHTQNKRHCVQCSVMLLVKVIKKVIINVEHDCSHAYFEQSGN